MELQTHDTQKNLTHNTEHLTLFQTDYLSYGEELTEPLQDNNGTILNKIGYTGHEHDYGTGFINMQARLQDPGAGKFLQVDPGYDYDQNDPMSWNLYNYTRCNPMNATDPTGMVVDEEGVKKNKKWKWLKTELFKSKAGRKLWKAISDDKNSTLKIKMVSSLKEDGKKEQLAKITDQKYENGELVSATLEISESAIEKAQTGSFKMTFDKKLYPKAGMRFNNRNVYDSVYDSRTLARYLLGHELGHFESKMHQTPVLDSYLEYKKSFYSYIYEAEPKIKRKKLKIYEKVKDNFIKTNENYADAIGSSCIKRD